MTRRTTFAMLVLLSALPLAGGCGSDAPSSDGRGGGGGGAGTSVTSPGSLEDSTYALSIPKVNWTLPSPAVGKEIGPFVPTFIIKTTGAATGTIKATLGTADSSLAQDECTPTVETPASGDDHMIGPVDFPVVFRNQDKAKRATIKDFKLTGVLPSSGAAGEGELTGTIDLRELATLFTLLGSDPTAERACTGLATMSAECQPCSDDEKYCLPIKAVDIGATENTSISMKTITAASVASSCPK